MAWVMDIHPFSMGIFLFCEKVLVGNLILTRTVRCSPFLGSLRILVFQTTFMFSTGIKATPTAVESQNIVCGRGKPKNIVAGVTPFRRSENQYIDFRLPFLFLN